MTFQKSQAICHLGWETVAGCSQFYLEIFFVPMLLTETRSLESHSLEEKKNKHAFDHLLIWLSSQDLEADLLGTYLFMCTFMCPLTEWKMLSVLTAFQDEPKW